MAKIHTPNKGYNGISAGVDFRDGVGECSDPYLLAWFTAKGYEVEPDPKPKRAKGSKEVIE